MLLTTCHVTGTPWQEDSVMATYGHISYAYALLGEPLTLEIDRPHAEPPDTLTPEIHSFIKLM